ncbi:O-succinylbenzoic acid--CoA ligase [Quadrisphaera sp. DSM 44207]|nr:O-succinylbenzoic acid--CoA ligase [Quadrisphaera sp. DSM 44207]
MRVLPSPAPDDAPLLLEALGRALAGTGPALLPVPDGAPGRALLDAASLGAAPPGAGADGDADGDGGVALLLATSGSTGAPKLVELGAAALLASARASAQRLGGHAQWLLALPLLHVAGWQVLVRSAAAGTEPVAVGERERSDPRAVAAAIARMSGERRCTALVPTQLVRLLEHPGAAAALAGLDAVLLGGAASAPALLERARAAGVRVVTTYGGTETSGGCVYDGIPLDGVAVAVEPDGRVLLGGPVLARGYRGDPAGTARAFVRREGRRWFATSDLGRVGPDGALRVLGRLDDVLVTGGAKVAPAAVEAVLGGLPGVAQALAVAVPDPEWGQRVVALLVPARGAPGPPDLAAVRAAVTARLGAPSAPRELLVVDALPERGVGKPDRAAAAALAVRLLEAGG